VFRPLFVVEFRWRTIVYQCFTCTTEACHTGIAATINSSLESGAMFSCSCWCQVLWSLVDRQVASWLLLPQLAASSQCTGSCQTVDTCSKGRAFSFVSIWTERRFPCQHHDATAWTVRCFCLQCSQQFWNSLFDEHSVCTTFVLSTWCFSFLSLLFTVGSGLGKLQALSNFPNMQSTQWHWWEDQQQVETVHCECSLTEVKHVRGEMKACAQFKGCCSSHLDDRAHSMG